MRDEKDQQPLNPQALTVAQAAKVLSAALGRQVTEQQVQQVADAGGLVRGDGTINLLQYTAMLAKEVAGGTAED